MVFMRYISVNVVQFCVNRFREMYYLPTIQSNLSNNANEIPSDMELECQW